MLRSASCKQSCDGFKDGRSQLRNRLCVGHGECWAGHTLLSERKVPTKEVASSGAEDPAAMKVAPATSLFRFRPKWEQIISRDAVNWLSQMIAIPKKM